MVRKDPKTPKNTHINRYLYIKVYGRDVNKLVGLPGLRHYLGDVLSDKVLDKVFNSNLERVEFKFRRGLKVTVYAK